MNGAIFDIGESYQVYRFEASINIIAKYFGANFDSSGNISYIVIKFKNTMMSIPDNMKRALLTRPRSGSGKRRSISM